MKPKASNDITADACSPDLGAARVLPSHRSAASDARYNPGIEDKSRQQGAGPVTDLDSLAGDWPESDSIDEFLEMVRVLRGG